MAEKRAQVIPYVKELTALQGKRLYEKAPFGCYVEDVIIHWPDGCDGVVDVRVCHGRTQFLPREGYLALDAATPKYSFEKSVPVSEAEEIWVEMRNGDSANPHKISVSVKVVEQ